MRSTYPQVVVFPVAQPSPKNGGAPGSSPGGARPGFTLVEVVFCIVIFAIGFLVMAMMLPAGALMQKEILSRTDASIIGKNSLEVVKAKGIFSGSNEWVVRLGGTTTYSGNQGNWSWGGLPGCLMNTNAMAAVFPAGSSRNWIKDMEHVAVSQEQSLMASASSTVGQETYWDTNGGGTCIRDRWGHLRLANWQYGGFLGPYSFSTGGGYGSSGYGSDLTNWGEGRINMFKNRPIPGVTPSFFAQGDFSAPSSVFDVSRRQYVSYVHYADRSTTPQGGEEQYKVYNTHDWRMLATTMARPGDVPTGGWNSTAEIKGWPEQVEWDLALPDQLADANPANPVRHTNNKYDISSTCAHFRMSNSGSAFRWGGLPAAKKGWCGRFNSRIRDWNGILCTGVRDAGYAGWDNYTLGANYFYGFPIRDSSQTTYDWRSAYVSPVPMDVLAIVYDKNRDLLLLRYPQCFAKIPDSDGSKIPGAISGGSNPRLTGAANGNVFPTGAAWVDRRLKVGDHMVTLTNAHHFQVTQVLDVEAEGDALSAARGGPMDWKDGTYQLVKVTPPLATTMLSDNSVSGATDWPSNDETRNPYLYRVIVGTPPVTGGANPLQSVDEMPMSGRNCGGVFRMDDDLCN